LRMVGARAVLVEVIGAVDEELRRTEYSVRSCILGAHPVEGHGRAWKDMKGHGRPWKSMEVREGLGALHSCFKTQKCVRRLVKSFE